MGRTNNLARELQKLAETKAKQDSRAQERLERLKRTKVGTSAEQTGESGTQHRDPEMQKDTDKVGSPTSSSSSSSYDAVEGGMFAAFAGGSSAGGASGSCRSTSNTKGQTGSFGSSGQANSSRNASHSSGALSKNLVKRETRRVRQHKNVTNNHAHAGIGNNTCIKVQVDSLAGGSVEGKSEYDEDKEDEDEDEDEEDDADEEEEMDEPHTNTASGVEGGQNEKMSTQDEKIPMGSETHGSSLPTLQDAEKNGVSSTKTGDSGAAASPASGNAPSSTLSFADMLRKKESASATQNPSTGTTPTSSSPGKSQATSPNSVAVKRVYPRLTPQPFSHILVCDFEATCDASNPGYPHEIIEFPVVCLDTATLETVAIFHTYVKPTKRPRLTKFCTDLTGIRQSDVEGAPTIVEALVLFRTWLHETVYPLVRERLTNGPPLCKNLKRKMRADFVFDDDLSTPEATGKNGETVSAQRTKELEMHVCFATDGPWDMKRFVVECHVHRDGIAFPPLFYRYINVRRLYSDCMKKRATSLMLMLRKLGLGFVGRQHSGIDDTKNIARVVSSLLTRGFRIGHISVIKYGAAHMYVDDSDEDGMDSY